MTGRSLQSASVSLGERYAVLGRLAADEAFAGSLLVRVDRADGHPARLGLDPRLAFGVTAPGSPHKTPTLPEVRGHLGQRRELERVLALKFLSAFEEPRLERHQLFLQSLRDAGDRYGPAFARQSIHQLHLAGVDISRAHVQPQRDALELPVRVFVAGPLVAPVDAVADPRRLQLAGPAIDEPFDLGAALRIAEDRHDDHLDRRHLGGHDDARIAAVGHHQWPDETRADAPRRRVAELFLVVLVGERDVVGAREVLPEVVRRAHLPREAVAHQAFDREGVNCAGERFRGRLLAAQHRNREPVLGYGPVVPEDQVRLFDSLLRRGVERVAFLPPELARP